MLVPDDWKGSHRRPKATRLHLERKLDVRRSIELELLIEPEPILQERSRKRHQVAFHRVHLGSWRFVELAEVARHDPEWPGQADGGVSEGIPERSERVTVQLDRAVHDQHHLPRGA